MTSRSQAVGPVGGVLLFPGAGADRDHHTLVALEEALAPLPVRRADFPYRREGRKAPDRAPKLIASVVEAAAAMASEVSIDPGAIVLGGRSMGGRMCSMAVAEGLPSAGLVLLSYPLHPPGKPEKLRTEHFPELAVPCLFLSGDRDPFGTPEELAQHSADIPGAVTMVVLEGARHDPKGADATIVTAVRDWVGDLRG